MRWGTADGAAFRPTFSPQSSAYSSPFTCYLLCLPTTIKNNLCGTPPSREIAAVAMLPRKDSQISVSSRALAWRSLGIKYGVYATHFFRGIAAVAMLPRNDSTRGGAIVPWDISLTLNMTYFFFYVILNDSEESHRRTDGAYTSH